MSVPCLRYINFIKYSPKYLSDSPIASFGLSFHDPGSVICHTK